MSRVDWSNSAKGIVPWDQEDFMDFQCYQLSCHLWAGTLEILFWINRVLNRMQGGNLSTIALVFPRLSLQITKLDMLSIFSVYTLFIEHQTANRGSQRIDNDVKENNMFISTVKGKTDNIQAELFVNKVALPSSAMVSAYPGHILMMIIVCTSTVLCI